MNYKLCMFPDCMSCSYMKSFAHLPLYNQASVNSAMIITLEVQEFIVHIVGNSDGNVDTYNECASNVSVSGSHGLCSLVRMLSLWPFIVQIIILLLLPCTELIFHESSLIQYPSVPIKKFLVSLQY